MANSKITIDEANFAVTIHPASIGNWTGFAPTFVSRGAYDFDDLGDILIDDELIPASRETIKLVLRTVFEVIAEEVRRAGTVSARFGCLRFFPSISGSFRTLDGAWDPEVNSLNPLVGFTAEVASFLVNVTPAIVRDDSDVLLRLFRMMDLETEAPYVIAGRYQFRVNGSNIFLDREGEEAYFLTGNGTKYPATLVDSASPQRAVFRLTTLPPKGCSGRFYVKSYGHNRTATDLQVDYLGCTFFPKADPPTPQPTVTKWYCEDGENKIHESYDNYIEGTLLNGFTSVTIHAVDMDGQPMEVNVVGTVNEDGTKITYIPSPESDLWDKSQPCTVSVKPALAAEPVFTSPQMTWAG